MKRYVSGPDADVLASEEWVEAIEGRLDKRIAAMVKQLGTVGEALLRETGRLDKRLTALEDEDRQGYWSAIEDRLSALEAHDKCQNCAVSPYVEAEKHTCGECHHAHWNSSPVGLCVEIPHCEWDSIMKESEACPNFKAKKGAA